MTRRRWRPRLATTLVVSMLALLAVVLVSFSALLVLLTREDLLRQLDENVREAAERSFNYYMDNPRAVGPPRARDPLATRGQQAGLLNVVSNNSFIFPAAYLRDGEVVSLSTADLNRLIDANLLAQNPQQVQVKELGEAQMVRLDIGLYRLRPMRISFNDRYAVVLAGLPADSVEESVTRLVVVTTMGGLSALMIAAGAGSWLIRRALKPLERVSEVAKGVADSPLASGDVTLLQNRVPPELADPGTEVGDVGNALNLMLDNVQDAFVARQHTEAKLRSFVADASHELRTPLTAIRGYADMLKITEKLSPEGEKSLSRVESQSARMSALVEDLLTLARLDAGRTPELRPVELNELVVEGVLDANAAGPTHTWQCHVPEEPVVVRGDRAQLTQVITNLLSNARKHTPEGTTVSAGLRRSDGSEFASIGLAVGRYAVLRIQDDGPGIEASFLPKLFDRFSRADSSRRSADETSTGLGLAITKALVDSLRGRILVESSTGAATHHTAFTIVLPEEPSPEAAGPPGSATLVPRPAPAASVLSAEVPPAGAAAPRPNFLPPPDSAS